MCASYTYVKKYKICSCKKHICRYQTDTCVIIDYQGITRKLVFSNGDTGGQGLEGDLFSFLYILTITSFFIIYAMLIRKINKIIKKYLYTRNTLKNSNYANTIPIQQKKSGQVLLRLSL